MLEARGQAGTKASRWRVSGAVVVFALMTAFLIPAAHASSAPTAPAVPDELIVGYRQGSTPEQRSKARGRTGAAHEERVVREGQGRGEVERVKLPRGKHRDTAIAELQSDPAVAYAEPNWFYTKAATSNDPYYTKGSLWGMYGDGTSPANEFGSQAGEAWAAGNTGSNQVVVGVIDEGIQVDHSDLSANKWTNPGDRPGDGVDNDGNGYADDVNGWDFVNNDNTVYDGGRKANQDKHGTHVAGIIGAKGGNGTGVAGANWNVTMISAKFLGRSGGTLANAVKAVDYFTDLKKNRGVNVVATNNSWGGGGYSQALFEAIGRASLADILFIAAAGNGGSDGVGDDNDKTPHYPSSYTNANVVAVASITSSGAKSSFSNFGSTSVDLGAPGSDIYSTLPNNSYGSYSGTSMATPHVTGGAALYAASHPGATAADIKAAIMGSAKPTSSMTAVTLTGGRLNVSGFYNLTSLLSS
ncbi:MAG: S8 family serine peptidase [Actinomycetota bacterium]|nr:S8 family serine peptidase [Actinomycetota bacterium]